MADVRRRATGIVALALAMLLLSGCTDGMRRWYHLRRADQFFQAQQYESAKIEYLNVLRLDVFESIDDGPLEFLGVFLGGGFSGHQAGA